MAYDFLLILSHVLSYLLKASISIATQYLDFFCQARQCAKLPFSWLRSLSSPGFVLHNEKEGHAICFAHGPIVDSPYKFFTFFAYLIAKIKFSGYGKQRLIFKAMLCKVMMHCAEIMNIAILIQYWFAVGDEY